MLLPHIAERPLTLKRYPDGVTGQHFYNKHAPDHRPDWVRTKRLPAPGSTSGRDWVRYVITGDLPTLIWTANLAGLELHTPMWRLGRVADPDLLVFDLDPGAPATIVECCPVALLLRPLLAETGLVAFPKTRRQGLQFSARCRGPVRRCHAICPDHGRATGRDTPRVVSRMTKTCGPGRSSSTGARTTRPRPRSRPTRCVPAASPPSPPRSPGTRSPGASGRRTWCSPAARCSTGWPGTVTCSPRWSFSR